MTINKLTLAAALTIGLMAGTMNSGIASNVDITNLDMTKLAACPISGCQADVTPSTAVCPCTPVPKDDCGCETGAAAPCPCDPCNTCAPVEPCDPCEAAAPPCDCQPVVQSVCASQCDGKSVSKQHYAYPANVYSDSQSVGSTANNVIIGESSQCGCSLCPTPGVMVSDLPTCGCGCGEGITTGAAADMPVIGNTNFDINQVITGGAAPVDPTAVTGGCPVEMQTSSGMEVIKRTITPYNPPITGAAAPITGASSFEDVPDGFWAGCDINLLAENKVVAGYPDRTFKPNLPVSRAEIASMAVNGFNLRSCGCPSKQFKDVPADHWANQAINTAVANGLMDGYPGDMFKPNKPVTRAEAMVTLAKGIPCEMDNCKADQILSKYCDGNKVPAWAKIPVAKAIESGALSDIPNSNEIQACKDASRADVASMLESVRVAMGYSKKDVAYTSDCGCTGGAAFIAKDEVVTIPTLCLKFEDEISAKSATIGDRFAAKTTESVTINGQTFPAGSNVYGKVTEVERPSGNCKGGLKLSFERIQCHDCKADLPQQVLTAQVKTDKKPNFFAKLIEAPFTFAGGVVGTIGRTVGGAIIAAGNAAEHVTDGVGLTLGETLQGQLPAAGRSLMDASKALVKAPVDLTRTALSGTIGLLQHTGDEVAYLVDPKGNRVTSVNPRENITVAFGCNSCTGCAAPIQPCNPCEQAAPSCDCGCDANPCDCDDDCGCK